MNKIKKWYWLIAAVISLGFSVSEVNADNHMARSCSRDDVASAINAASAGDTVNVPPGSCYWANQITITKGINLIGSGMERTIIVNNTSNHSAVISYTPSDYNLDIPFRISGFTFDLNRNGHGIYLGEDSKAAPFTMQSRIRIDHNRFINAPVLIYQAIINKCLMNGVVDSNTFDGVWYPIRNDPGLSASAARSWYKYFYPLWSLGGSYYLIYEDNTFSDLRDGTNIDSILTDCQYGGRYVFRYNTISLYKGSQNLFDVHGYDANGGPMYGCFGAEIYGNDITVLAVGVSPASLATVTLMANRSGKSMVFYNSATTPGKFDGHSYNNPGGISVSCPLDYIEEQLIHDTYIWSNRKNFINRMDNWYSQYPMSCNGLDNIPLKNRDFYTDVDPDPGILCGRLENRPKSCRAGQGYWATNQSCTDLRGMVGAMPPTPISGTFYRCTTADNWDEFYTPYEYPHPLRGEGNLAIPKNLRVVPYSASGESGQN